MLWLGTWKLLHFIGRARFRKVPDWAQAAGWSPYGTRARRHWQRLPVRGSRSRTRWRSKLLNR